MAKSLKESVGRNGKNFKADVELVQNLLSEYILEGRLGPMSILDEEFAGAGSDTERAIREFQTRVMRVPPTGIVRPLSAEFASLLKTPKQNSVLDVVYENVDLWMKKGPPKPNIANDLWLSALRSLRAHATHPRLQRYSKITLIDYRIPRSHPRLWVVDAHESRVELHTHVAHGKGGQKKPAGDIPHNFGEKYSTLLGAYIATNQDMRKAGQKIPKGGTRKDRPRGPVVLIEGLDESNRTAARIGIMFHGAHYVTPPVVKNSWGCFATAFIDNVRILDMIKGGSFVYAYAGDALAPAP